MKYYVNGDEVSERVFEREAIDNLNLRIRFIVETTPDATYMTYEEEV